MKTAISLPDEVFRAGDALAKKLQLTRSELYVRALEEYLAKHKAQRVTERLDAVYAKEDSRLDPALTAVQVRALRRERW
jgi:predicted transcriptional regulator